MGVWIETCWLPWFDTAYTSHTLRGCVDWNSYMRSIILSQHVTPCVGVWIETVSLTRKSTEWSHTLRGCVDWNDLSELMSMMSTVTPCVGVWIETNWQSPAPRNGQCHTLRGCVDWNSYSLYLLYIHEVTPCVGVWIETENEFRPAEFMQSHPAWVCGLKQFGVFIFKHFDKSHPAWVCGLKQVIYRHFWSLCYVTPCVGVWIETQERR